LNQLVLDSGALIALERDDRALWAAVKQSALAGSDVYVPSAALAQVWRGSPSQARLARALHHCVIASFDDHAKKIGELCGRARTTDVCDAQVAIIAATLGDVVYTSDPKDLRRLIAAFGGPMPVIVRC
jgi:predicted nucleic acid-binding protein